MDKCKLRAKRNKIKMKSTIPAEPVSNISHFTPKLVNNMNHFTRKTPLLFSV